MFQHAATEHKVRLVMEAFGVSTLKELAMIPDQEILRLSGVGKATLRVIRNSASNKTTVSEEMLLLHEARRLEKSGNRLLKKAAELRAVRRRLIDRALSE